MKTEPLTFGNCLFRLSGTLYKPNGDQPCPALIAVHPASQGEGAHPFHEHLKTGLPPRGIAVLVFDRRGSGGSEGDFETAGFEDLAGDVIAAVKYLQARSNIDRSGIGLHGTSQGGRIAPIAAAKHTEIPFIVAVSASGVSPAEQMDYGVTFHLERAGYDRSVVERVLRLRHLVNKYFRGHLSRTQVAAELRGVEHEPWFEMAYLYPAEELPDDVTQSKWHYEMDYEPLSIWKRVKQPSLFIFAELDEWVSIEQSMINYKKTTGHLDDFTFVRIDSTDHLMSSTASADESTISRDYLDIL